MIERSRGPQEGVEKPRASHSFLTSHSGPGERQCTEKPGMILRLTFRLNCTGVMDGLN